MQLDSAFIPESIVVPERELRSSYLLRNVKYQKKTRWTDKHRMMAYTACIDSRVKNQSPFLRTSAFIFCLSWGRPCGNHAKRCMNTKTIQCLPNPSQHIPIYLEQFPSYSNLKCKKSIVSELYDA